MNVQYKKKTICSVCESKLKEPIIHLSCFPVLTGVFAKERSQEKDCGVDQDFCFCSQCGHGQLSTIVDPKFLYNQNYKFRTSLSCTSTWELKKFVVFLEQVSEKRIFNKIVDIGCNDLYLLKQMEKKGKSFCGVDMASGVLEGQKESQNIEIKLISKMAEDLNLDDFSGESPDLIISTHTFEHVEHPKEMLTNLMKCSCKEALFVFEFPCLEQMIGSCRFDRIFHQHLQYFSLESFKNLLNRVGAEYIDHSYNALHWGSLTVAFQKKRNVSSVDPIAYQGDISEKIRERYSIFRQEMEKAASEIKMEADKSVVGYGATNMLPILFYHLGIDDNFLDLVFDDDTMKNNLYFQGLDVLVRKADSLEELKDKVVVVTALDHVKPIVERISELSLRKIIIPLKNLPQEERFGSRIK